jgi:methionyl-tRNA formyltransferase
VRRERRRSTQQSDIFKKIHFSESIEEILNQIRCATPAPAPAVAVAVTD